MYGKTKPCGLNRSLFKWIIISGHPLPGDCASGNKIKKETIDVLVTDESHEVLSAGVPKTIAEIEDAINVQP